MGGTVGDIESLPFVEAMRQLQWELPEEDFLSIHLTLIPYLKSAGELKTKPTQHSVQELQSIGVHPEHEVDIALVGKYVEADDEHAGRQPNPDYSCGSLSAFSRQGRKNLSIMWYAARASSLMWLPYQAALIFSPEEYSW